MFIIYEDVWTSVCVNICMSACSFRIPQVSIVWKDNKKKSQWKITLGLRFSAGEVLAVRDIQSHCEMEHKQNKI